jgi:hypothetical protein
MFRQIGLKSRSFSKNTRCIQKLSHNFNNKKYIGFQQCSHFTSYNDEQKVEEKEDLTNLLHFCIGATCLSVPPCAFINPYATFVVVGSVSGLVFSVIGAYSFVIVSNKLGKKIVNKFGVDRIGINHKFKKILGIVENKCQKLKQKL